MASRLRRVLILLSLLRGGVGEHTGKTFARRGRCQDHHICDDGDTLPVTRCTNLTSNRNHSSKGAIDLSRPDDARYADIARHYHDVFRRASYKWREPLLRPFFWPNASYRIPMEYMNQKTHVLQALTSSMRIPDLWQPGRSLLDLGCGPGYFGAYLQAVHGITVIGYDVPFTAQCEGFLVSPFRVNFMTSESTPHVPEPPRSVDAVSILNVLHHVAERTPAVLEQAAALARTPARDRPATALQPPCNRPATAHATALQPPMRPPIQPPCDRPATAA